jgi:hypothetical protein
MIYDAGIPILAGTDDTAGIMLHRELELEVRAGIPPPKALQIAAFYDSVESLYEKIKRLVRHLAQKPSPELRST